MSPSTIGENEEGAEGREESRRFTRAAARQAGDKLASLMNVSSTQSCKQSDPTAENDSATNIHSFSRADCVVPARQEHAGCAHKAHNIPKTVIDTFFCTKYRA